MQLFYTTQFENGYAFLNANDSHHVVKVLRKHTGDEVNLTDGKGNLYLGKINSDDPRKCSINILGKKAHSTRAGFYLHIAIAPTKNISRLEWFIEKATEIGIDEITPLICEHSERKIIKKERLEKVAIAAMKQSLKTWLPVINEISGFQQFITSNPSGLKYIAYISPEVTLRLQERYRKGNNCILVIGPEGDFSAQEVAAAQENGFVPISLGNSRLRTETAGVMGCALINLLNQ